MNNDITRKFRRYFFLALGLSLLFHLVSLILGKTILSEWRFNHLPIHSVVEVAGSLIAFYVSWILLIQDKLKRGTSYNQVIASALVGMGVFDGIHAMFHAGQEFVLFHSIATFWGGLIFSMVWLPEKFLARYRKNFFQVSFFFTLLAAGVTLFIGADVLPMLENGEFTKYAIFLNVTGGALLLLSSLKLFLKYRKTQSIDDILFFLHSLLFGLAALMFRESSLWDFPWWSWHVLRLAAYATALYFSILSEKDLEKDAIQLEAARENKFVLDRIEFILNSCEIGTWGYDFNKKEFIWDARMHALHGSSSFAEYVNFSDWQNIISKKTQRQFNDSLVDTIDKSKPLDVTYAIFQNQKTKYIHVTGKVIQVGNEKILNGIAQDVTVSMELSKVKSEFLANMSHEIRTPMNGIVGMISLINRDVLNIEQMKIFDIIKTSSEHLVAIVNDILDYSKIESGELRLDNSVFETKDIVSSVIQSCKSIAQKKFVKIDTNISDDLPSKLYGDHARIHQVISNVLNNAIKFSHDNSNVEFKINCQSVKNKITLDIVIKDFGLGITQEDQKILFSSFVQGDSSATRKYGGTGLGLAISYKIAKMMNGDIRVDSRVGEGSTFFITLVVENADEENLGNDFNPNILGTSFAEYFPNTILIVEDHEMNFKIAELIFKKLGYTVDHAENGLKAVEKCRSTNYDLVFMDLQMPEMDGITATKEILTNNPNPPVIIAMTANVFESDRNNCMKVGMMGFIGKPIKLEDIAREIRILGKKAPYKAS